MAHDITEPVKKYILYIQHDGEMMIGILDNGTVEYGVNYNPDEAARIFWACIAGYAPVTLPSTPYQDPTENFWDTERVH